ncbi:MAG: M28 family peptidase [Promethearchaeota archaeon]
MMEESSSVEGFLESFIKEISIPRFSGSQGSKMVISRILKACDGLGLDAEKESFRISSFFMVVINKIPYFLHGFYILLITCFSMILANPFLNILTWFGAIVIAISLERIINFLKYPSMHSRFAIQQDATNIIVSNPKMEVPSEHVARIHVVTHHDSKSEWPSPHVWYILEYLSVFLGTLILGLHVMIWSFLKLFLPGAGLHSAAWFFYGIFIAILDMARILTWYGEGRSRGANDDASGVAINLMLCKLLASFKFKNLVFKHVIVDAEELGEAGSYNYIRMHSSELSLERDHFFIIDGLSSSELYYFNKRGLDFKAFSPELVKAFDFYSRNLDQSFQSLRLRRTWMPPSVNTDHSPVVKLGYKAFVLAGKESVSHTIDDTPDRLDYKALNTILDLLLGFFKHLDDVIGSNVNKDGN